MKRSEILNLMEREWRNYIDNLNPENAGVRNAMTHVLAKLEEAGMTPKPYIHPRAVADGLGDPKWGYIEFIDKYPEHHFRRGRPYEYYVDGWEPEDG